jgi:hypothetical protein
MDGNVQVQDVMVCAQHGNRPRFYGLVKKDCHDLER